MLRRYLNRHALLILLLAIATGPARGEDRIEPAVGKKVTVQLRSGREFVDATIVRVDRDKQTGAAKRLRLKLADGKSTMVGISAVTAVLLDGETLYAAPVTDEHEDSTATPDDERTSRKKPRKKPKRLTRAERRAAEEAAERRRWLAQLEARGVKPWPDLTEAEHQEAIAAHKQRFEEARRLFPNLQLVETEHFLFCTNLTPREVGPHVAALDRMYAWMQNAYGVDPEKPVWRGKASVYAFRTVDEFAAFERRFFKNPLQSGTAGLCHQDYKRNICIAAHRGASLDYFAVVLVHETSHGFIHCYQTPVRVPSWVNEGMAEVIASMMVPQSKGVQRKEQQFVSSMRSTPQPRLGEAFFSVKENIPFDRYGGATSMTRFLLETEQSNYVRFIKLLKTGMPWEDALGQSYGANKQQLVTSFGRRIGVPHLAP